MKTELKLWKKYLAYLEKLNKPIREINKENLIKWKKDWDKKCKAYLLEEKAWEERRNKMDFLYDFPPCFPFVGRPINIPERQPSYEDFLTWAGKQR